jgi:hypothetical protein
MLYTNERRRKAKAHPVKFALSLEARRDATALQKGCLSTSASLIPNTLDFGEVAFASEFSILCSLTAFRKFL